MLQRLGVSGDRRESSVFRDVLNSERIGCEVEVRTVSNSRTMSYNNDLDLENSQPNGEEDVDVCDDEDIYGDLESAVFSATSSQKKSNKSRQELEDRLNTALIEISELKERVTALSTENMNLRSNFSSVLTTAKEERNKNVQTLSTLRNELKHVTSANSRGDFLSKAEINRINTLCKDAQGSLQSEISFEVLRKVMSDSKQKLLEDKRKQFMRPWSKRFKCDNISLYFSREQIPWARQEPVTFPINPPPPLPLPSSQQEVPPLPPLPPSQKKQDPIPPPPRLQKKPVATSLPRSRPSPPPSRHHRYRKPPPISPLRKRRDHVRKSEGDQRKDRERDRSSSRRHRK